MRGIPSLAILANAPWIRQSLSLTWSGDKEEAGKTLSLVTPQDVSPVPSAKGVAKSLLVSGTIGYINEKKRFTDLLCVSFSSIVEAENISGLLFYEQSDAQSDHVVNYEHVTCFTLTKHYELSAYTLISKRHYLATLKNLAPSENKQPELIEIHFFLKDGNDSARSMVIWSDPAKALTLTIRNKQNEVTIGPLDPDLITSDNEPLEPVVGANDETLNETSVLPTEEVGLTLDTASVSTSAESTGPQSASSVTMPEIRSSDFFTPELLSEWNVDQLRLLRDALTRKITYMEADAVIARVNSYPAKTIGMLQHLQTLLELRNLQNPPLRLIESEVEILQAMAS